MKRGKRICETFLTAVTDSTGAVVTWNIGNGKWTSAPPSATYVTGRVGTWTVAVLESSLKQTIEFLQSVHADILSQREEAYAAAVLQEKVRKNLQKGEQK